MPSHLKRHQNEGNYHFITFSCYQRRPYLDSDHARAVFLDVLEKVRQRHRILVFGYVLMPEHIHLLLNEPERYSLGKSLGVLKRESSKKLKGTRKQFWQDRYFDFNVLTQPKFVEKLKYIHRNPQTRGLLQKPEDWPWSSFRHYALGERTTVQLESKWKEYAAINNPDSRT